MSEDHDENGFYEIRVIHSLNQKESNSVVQVFQNHIFAATSVITKNNELPIPTQLHPNPSNIITLDGGTERVFTIKNANGDWAAVKGRWTAFRPPKRGIPGTDTVRGIPGDPGDSGYLDLNVFHNRDQLEPSSRPVSKKDPKTFQLRFKSS